MDNIRSSIELLLIIIAFMCGVLISTQKPVHYPEKVVINDRTNKAVITYYATMFVHENYIEIGDATEIDRIDVSLMTE